MAWNLQQGSVIELKYGKRKVVSYRGARMVVGGLTSKNKIDILVYMAKELANVQNQQDLFDAVVALSQEIFEVDNITLRLWQNQKLVPVRFLKETDPPRRELKAGEGYSGAVFAEKKAQILDNLENFPGYLDEQETTRCAIVVPILLRDEALGTIAIEKDVPYFYKKDDLEILDAMASQVALALNEVKLIEGLMEAQSRLASDLKMGRSVQSQIIPSEIHAWNSLRFGHYFEPMVEVSGDYVDVMRSGNTLTCFMADVSGHGVPAALVTMALHFQFRRCVDQGLGLTEMMVELNESIRHRLPEGTYFTAQLVRVYADHTFSFVNAGHVRLLHYKRAAGDFSTYDTRGMPLGIMEVKRADYEEKFGNLEPGDLIFMLTDGFHEQRNAAHEAAGPQRLFEWLTEIVKERDISEPLAVCREFLHLFNEFVGSAPREDDLTLLVLECSRHLQGARNEFSRAKRLRREGQLDDAEHAALECYRLDASYHDNLMLLSRIYYDKRDLAKSARFLGEYIASSGASRPEFHHMLGVMHYRMQDIPSAKRELKKALSIDHANVRSNLMLARCYLKEGSVPRAVKTLQRALQSVPGNEKLKQALRSVETLPGSKIASGGIAAAR
jgi:sigma-B regulation protein RsbU (phosphoserine phosphatase)